MSKATRTQLDQHFYSEEITAIMAIRTRPPHSTEGTPAQWHIVFRLISSNVLVFYLDVYSRKEDGTANPTTHFMGPGFTTEAQDEFWMNLPKVDRDLTYGEICRILSDKVSKDRLRLRVVDGRWDELWLGEAKKFLEEKGILTPAPPVLAQATSLPRHDQLRP